MNARRYRLAWERYQGRNEQLAGRPTDTVMARGYLRVIGQGEYVRPLREMRKVGQATRRAREAQR